MSRIIVTPEQLHELGRQLQRTAGELHGLRDRLGGALGRLDWEARQKVGIDGRVNDARGRANDLAGRCEALARYLERQAQSFLEADRQGVATLPTLPPTQGGRVHILPWFPGQEPGQARILPWPFSRWLPVSIWLAPLTTWLAMRSPGLFRRPPAIDNGRLQPQPPGWVPKRPATPQVTPPAQEATSSGQLAERAGAQTSQPAALAPEGQAPAAPPAGQWWRDVPLASQQGLKTPDGAPTNYGCAPTATSMVLDYWHAQDPANKAATAQALIDENAAENEFKAVGGMSISKIHDEVKALGYGVSEDKTNATAEELKAAVAQGPVIAIVKLGMGTTGANHSVVVTGISPEGKVRINDPWDGKAREYTWEEFASSWGAGFGKDAPKNNLTVIRPS